jgi:macrolide-specific efflux system membrane fusion protein
MRLKLVAIVLLLVVGGAALVVTLGGFPRSAAAATTYLTATAAVADVQNDVAATGAIESSTSWNLAFGAVPTTGSVSDSSSAGQGGTGTWTVAKVDVRVGDTVTKGQILATASNADLAAQIGAAKNDYAIAGINKEQAQTAYDNATTDSAISQARANLLNATNQFASARKSLDDLKATAARNQLVAPAAGVVTAVNVTAGADPPTGAAITIASTDYQVTASVVESDVSSMRLQQPATVSVAAIGATLEGIVTAIAPTADSSSSSGNGVVSYAVTVALKSPPATLRAGMTAEVTITTASASGVLAVPAAAVRGVNGNYSVLVMTASGTPEACPVTVGLMTSSLVEIQSGLTAGDVVVIGTSSSQRSTTSGFGPNGGGTFVVPGGGRGNGGPVVETKP